MKVVMQMLMTAGAVASSCAALAAMPTAVSYNWQAIDGSWSGLFAEATHWRNGATGEVGASAPGLLSRAFVGADNGRLSNTITADATISFPDTDYDTYADISLYGAKDGHVLTVEGAGTVCQRTADAANFATQTPFRLYSWDLEQILKTSNSYLSEDLKYRQGGFLLTNPSFRLWTDAQNVIRADTARRPWRFAAARASSEAS